jgi:hypothetical protein
MSFRALGGALANSFQIKTPHTAETIVAPCPIACEIAGPMMWACEAAKFKTAQVPARAQSSNHLNRFATALSIPS